MPTNKKIGYAVAAAYAVVAALFLLLADKLPAGGDPWWLGLFGLVQAAVAALLVRRHVRERPRVVNRLQKNNQLLLLQVFGFGILYLVLMRLVYGGLDSGSRQMGMDTLLLPVVLADCLLMELRRLGVLGGRRNRAGKWSTLVAKRHGYVVGLWTIGVLWGAPALGSAPTVLGFVYGTFLLVQMALTYTTLHFSKYLNVWFEVVVLLHLAGTAAGVGGAVGTAAAAAVTLAYLLYRVKGLGWGARTSWILGGIWTGLFAVGIAFLALTGEGMPFPMPLAWVQGGVAAFALLWWLGFKLEKGIR
ncbi:hypothetical protein [Anaerotalea alkaliphila]|uniref:Uncharacterized protein n=1 Tax=Anaerotalea alkaliphila TaxID=2662126 RepID=A0A7X5KLV6_9FIRM|nr:hypothetical protein [Anaerotalea alkaliphila]NDL67099.1 hypothetical protein [Anaerotalea alkaliphila]